MMQPITLPSGSTESPAGIPPFSYRNATGLDSTKTKAAAQIMAARIVEVWSLEGHSVDAWVVQMPGASVRDEYGSAPSWGVRTDLVNGMPSGLGRAAWERKFGRGI